MLEIQDINIAAYLIICGHRVEKISRDGPTIYWHFAETKAVHERIGDFISGDATGDCKRFADALKTLKQTLRTN